MKRTFRSFSVNNIIQTKWQMLGWAKQFNICCFLDNHQYHFNYTTVEGMLAVGSNVQSVEASAGTAFNELNSFIAAHPNEWLFGHLGYDLKGETDGLPSAHADRIGFPDLFFFIPEIIVLLEQNAISIGAFDGHEAIAHAIFSSAPPGFFKASALTVQARFNRDEYINTIQNIQQHILRGDCYELNFCQEFYSEEAAIDPLNVYYTLCHESPNPFAAYYRLNDRYLLCASPERYLKKMGLQIISQPIKGTSGRYNADLTRDNESLEGLRNNPKDRAENIMIVDLVRNDLAKICEEGSVVVEELLGAYSFPQVHQLISTVKGSVSSATSVADILKAAFPMGSMTGAPKRRVMQLIEQYERTKRGLFSGSVGYISPEKDFDFNVVIRSILYNASRRYLSFQAGSAITYHSEPGQEYDECVLKAAAIQKVLGALPAYQ